jgi:hypothetical protein
LCNFAIAVGDIYLMAFIGKKSGIEIDFKKEFIKIFIRQLKEI